MAYVIGSQKGKDKAESMKTNESWTNPADGSTWTKQADGSVSVKTSKGETFNNAYTPTSSGGTSGGSTGGYVGLSTSGSTGGSKNGYNGYIGGTLVNSQYTAPDLGTTWDANTDYQAIIDLAEAYGDYQTAARAEQLRNQKIISLGLNYDKTNKYTDLLLQDYMQMMNQQNSQDMYNQWTQDYDQNNPKETYTSKYDPAIEALLNQILTRDDFSYDAANDPLYQQYAQMYQREGDRAMRDTLAEVAAGAGGMNSYAITAAQQANNYYNSQLTDKIPELYQLAYQMYLNDKESKVQDLGILQNMDATQYNRYRDTINDWYNDKTFAYNAFNDAVQQGNWETSFDYNAMWNNKTFDNDNYWAKLDYDTTQADKELENSRYDSKTAYDRIVEQIGYGVTTFDPKDLEAAGLTQAAVDQMIAEKKRLEALSASSGSGSSKGSGSGGSKGSVTVSSTEDSNKTPIVNPNDSTIAGYLETQVNEGSLDKDTAADIYENTSFLSSANWELVSKGGWNWLGGLDENAEVKYTGGDGRGVYYTISELYEELRKGMGDEAAKKWIIALQKDLGISNRN